MPLPTLAAWQVAQPEPMPLWLNWPPANVVPDVAPVIGTSVAGTLSDQDIENLGHFLAGL